MLLYRFLPSQHLHDKRLLPTAEDPGSTGEFGRCWSFFMPRPKVWILANQDGQSSKQYTSFIVGNLGFFECSGMTFGLCNVPAMFQQQMQNCLRDLNLIYCFIYLDDIVIFSQTTEGHLHHLYIVFDQFREHNLKLKPSTCNFFREEVTYLAH